jgi:hypothetical protein
MIKKFIAQRQSRRARYLSFLMLRPGPFAFESPLGQHFLHMSGAKAAAELMRWYDKHDIVSSKVCIRTPEGGVRGLFARENILPFEGIAVIPPQMIIRSPFKDLQEIAKVKTHKLLKHKI